MAEPQNTKTAASGALFEKESNAMNTSSRTVRVFLSSTFRDFAEERDLLVRQIFPELRRKFRERQVELIDVDLRWGITEEEAQQGKVLPICLAEIDRARPYFMGFIGERYGWIPASDQYDPSILQEQPWLEEHRGGKSVTELEILHGVLNDPTMAGRAFFYFRDPKYSLAQGGAYLGESIEEEAKLNELKDRIRQSGFPVVEKYQNPAALAERVRADLWKLIDEAFPLEEVPDALTMERRRHEAYGASRLGIYLGGRKYFRKLDRAIHKTLGFKPVLITGESGGGKSALVANWMQAHAVAHPKTLTFVHHLGAGADAADPLKLVTRLLREISRVTGEKLQLESEPQKIFDLLPEWLARASAHAQKHHTNWLLIFDGLDKLSSLRDLRWWPGFLPQGIKLICSCLDGEVKDTALKRMKWTELGLCPLGKTDQAIFIKDFLARYGKFLTRPQLASVQAHPLSGNPLFLKTLLEELRVFGVHVKLDSKITHYLNSQSIDDLFEKVLERIEEDAGKKPVRAAMEAIWASRAGLAQDELLAIAKLKPAAWATIHNALDEALIDSNGRITFSHDYLRKAVEDRYLKSNSSKLDAHTRLAKWFESFPRNERASNRIVEELPWQWQQANNRLELKNWLRHRDAFETLFEENKYELLSYCNYVGEKYWSSIDYTWGLWCTNSKSDLELSELGDKLVEFLIFSDKCNNFSEALCVRNVEISRKKLGSNNTKTIKSMMRLGELLGKIYHYDNSVIILQEALTILRQDNKINTILTCETKSLLGEILPRRGRNGDLLLSVDLLVESYLEYKSLLGEFHSFTISSFLKLARIAIDYKIYKCIEIILQKYTEELSLLLGTTDPKTLECFELMGNLMDKKNKKKLAIKFYEKSFTGFVKLLGPDSQRMSAIAVYLSLNKNYSNKDLKNPNSVSCYIKNAESRFLNNINVFHQNVFSEKANLINKSLDFLISGNWGDTPDLGDPLEEENGISVIKDSRISDEICNLENIAELLDKAGDYDGAISVTEKILRIHKKLDHANSKSISRLLLLVCLLGETGRKRKCLEKLSKAFDLMTIYHEPLSYSKELIGRVIGALGQTGYASERFQCYMNIVNFKTLSEETNKHILIFETQPEGTNKRKLTKEIAISYLDSYEEIETIDGIIGFRFRSGCVKLNIYFEIEDEAAKELSRVSGHLPLSNIKYISDIAARALSRHEGHLDLRSLGSLSIDAAAYLSQHEGELQLSYLGDISDEAVKHLAKLEFPLTINLPSLSVEAAKDLADHRGGKLDIRGLKSINDEIAEVLARHSGELWLPDLRSISDTQAIKLSNHDGIIKFMSLHDVSDLAKRHLGNMLYRAADGQGAEMLYRQALAGYEKSLGAGHLDTMDLAFGLGCILNELGRRNEAISLLRRFATISEVAHHAIAYNLACYEWLEGNHAEAKRLISEQLKLHPEKKAQVVRRFKMMYSIAFSDHLKLHPEEKAQAFDYENWAAIRDWMETL
jgi:tetratricopeptide (TPR) repeat protein